MKINIHFLSVCLLLACFFFLPGMAVSQTDQAGNKTDTLSGAGVGTGGTRAVPSGITPGRARSLAGGVLGLISLIAGWRAKALSSQIPGKARSWAIAAVVLGIICIILSAVHLLTVSGGFGTGGGKAGAIIAFVPGLTGTILGGLALRTKK